MSSQMTLYDIPSQQGTAWSMAPWKVRMILNYKDIEYKTVWLEYPDLAPTLKSFGLPPNDKTAPGYTTDYSSPAVKYDDGSYGMDSWLIAHELEKRYPTPSLHLDDPIVIQIRDHVSKLIDPLVPHFIPKIPSLLCEPSAEYFHRARKEVFGAPLQELERLGANEKCWENAMMPAKEAGDLLRKNGGPFFLGETVLYPDLILVAMLHFMNRINKVLFERYLALDPAFPKVYEASRKWLQRDS
ncbi:hypothetical protein BKA66DRAFT_594405 [Pyrenochaeta sp. MPI-SDFR-AT-0127]|nr:hypothetical protein BKA66DRAFT_594405 [Pyrenochaeta sp. MPI-SDFR-AT-0127]